MVLGEYNVINTKKEHPPNKRFTNVIKREYIQNPHIPRFARLKK